MKPEPEHRHDHDHGVAALRAGARHIKPLLISFALIVAFLVVQVAVGAVTGSLALLSDAGHMATDALGMGIGVAIQDHAARSVADDCAGLNDDGAVRLVARCHGLAFHARGLGDEVPLPLPEGQGG